MRVDLVRHASHHPSGVIRAAEACSRGGFRRLWISEVAGFDAGVLAAHVLSRDPDQPVVVGPLPATLRTGPQLAMLAATLGPLGRDVTLALGASSPTITGGWHGRDNGSPRTIASVVDAYHQAAHGMATAVIRDKMSSRDFRLRVPPIRLPLAIAALGPRMRSLAARSADEIVLNLVTGDQAESHRISAETEVASVGSAMPRITVWVHVALDADGPDREHCRRFLARYLRAPGYRDSMSAAGFAGFFDGIAHLDDFDAIAARIPDDLLEAFIVTGDERDLAARLGEFERAGVDVALSCPLPSAAADRVLALLESVDITRLIDIPGPSEATTE